MDEEALVRLRQERIGWRFRGFPPDCADNTVDEVIAQGRQLLEGFTPPIAVLRQRPLEHNLAEMARYCTERGVELAPHGKSTMAPQLFQRQLEHGAWAMTAASLEQVRVFRAFGVQRILLANEVLDPTLLGWLANELADDPSFELVGYVDSVDGVQLMREALFGTALSRPLPVLIEVGAEGTRAGCRTIAEVEVVADAASRISELEPVGVAAFEGVVGGDPSEMTLDSVRVFLAIVRAAMQRLLDRKALVPFNGRYLLSAGGSAYFDLVVDTLANGWSEQEPIQVVLRSGCYVTHDVGFYRRVTPAARRDDGQPEFQPALEVWGQVISRPEPTVAIANVGRRDVSFDAGMPVPLHVLERATGSWSRATGITVSRLSDQHAFVTLAASNPLAVGDWIICGVSHPCTTFDKWSLIPVVDDDLHVIDCIRTFF